MFGKKGVLLINLGTPNSPEKGDVRRYLKEFLLDRRVIDINPIARNVLVRGVIAPFRSGSSAKGYQQLWTTEGSPLKYHGYQVAEGLQELLGEDYIVELAMRYQKPAIEEILQKMLRQEIRQLVVFPMYPQYASASTGSVHEEVMRILMKEEVIPDVRFVNSYPTHPKMIDAFVQRAKMAEGGVGSYDHVLFSFHGLPKRQLIKADRKDHCQQSEDCCQTLSIKNQHCYSAQCYATTKAIVKALDLKENNYSVCFQSRLGRDPWIKPYTDEMLKVRYEQGDRRILVFCPAFVADCLETTVEVSEEYAQEFKEMGGEHLELVEGLNKHPLWIEAIRDIVCI